jgi:molybdopterin-synthase adenylyltransferase
MKEIFSRNHFYIDPSLQSQIGSAKIAFLGTGLASSLAEIMVRTGFTNFFLSDGDCIELSNLNRQNFTNSDLGKNKASVLKNRLLAINPKISCICLEERIETLKQIEYELEQADIIINTVDCGPLYFDIIENYRKNKKLIICPFNPGFGGLVVCFTDTSSSAFDFFETENACDDTEVARCLLKKPGVTITEQVGKQNEDFFNALEEKGYFPQLGIGAALTGAITVTCAVDYLKKGTVRSSPNFYYIPAHFNQGSSISL